MLKNIKSITKNSIVYGLGNVSIKIVGLLLFPLYTENLNIEEYGMLGLLEISSQLLIAFFGINLQAAFFRLYYDYNEEKQKVLLFNALLFSGILSICMILVFLPLSEAFSNILFNSNDKHILIELILISSSIQILINIPNTLLRIKEKAVLYSVSMILKLLVILILTVLFITVYHRGIRGIIEAQIIGNFIYLLLMWVPIVKNIKIKIDIKLILDMVKFSLPLALSTIASVVLTISDRYMLKMNVGLTEVGYYSAGYKIANSLLLIFSSLQLAITPILYQKISSPDRQRFYTKVFTYVAFFGMIMVLGMSLYGKEILKFLSRDPNYWMGYRIITIIAFANFFNLLRYFSTTGLHIEKKTKVIASITIIVSVINIGLNQLFIGWFSYVGAAIATLITHIVFFILTIRQSQKVYFIPYELKKIMAILLVSITIVIAAIPLDNLSLIPRLIIKMSLILSFPFILYFTNFYEPIELERITQAWQKWSNIRNLRKNLLKK